MSMGFSLSDCKSALQADLIGQDIHACGVSIDTRTLTRGDLYVAIQGENFNGHEFVAVAEEAGASAVLVHEKVDTDLPQLLVEDTVVALGRLASWWASRFDIPIIAITGSNGKTSVKEIITAILKQLGPVLSTKGNLNNEIGVPLTLLRMRSEHLYAIVEMGANHSGEIARLVQIAKPDVALVNNIGSAHLEGFGSTEGIARAKSEIFSGLTEHGYAIINADDAFADFLRESASHCNTRDFGLSAGADVQGVPGAGLIIETAGTSLSPNFPLSGDHNGMNALAAVAAVQCLDVQPASIVRGLERVRPIPGRLEKKAGANGSTLIDDSYNANPDSTRQAINVLSRYSGTRYLVLGDMAELGEEAESLHSTIGAYAKQCGIDALWTTGPLSSHARRAFSGAYTASSNVASSEAPASLVGAAPMRDNKSGLGGHFTDQEALAHDLKPQLGENVTVLIKGSRGSKMERVVKALTPAISPMKVKIPEHSL